MHFYTHVPISPYHKCSSQSLPVALAALHYSEAANQLSCLVHRPFMVHVSDQATYVLRGSNRHIQPELLAPGSRRLRQVWDSLFTGDMESGNFGGGNMGQCNQTAPAGKARPSPPSPTPLAPGSVPSYYVNFATGSDGAAGSVADPFRTVAHAVRVSRGSVGPRRVVLRAGIHELPASLALGPQDNGLVIENYPQEEAWLSGAQSLNNLSWEQYHPPRVQGNLSNCSSSCLAAGHCCVGDISSYLTPSCAMGCTIAVQSASTTTCMKVCDEANRKGTFQWKNHTFNMGGSCPEGCSASDGVAECYQGCSFALGEPLLDIWQAKIPDSVNVSAGFFGLHTLADEDPWHTMMTRARYPNRQLGGESRSPAVLHMWPFLPHHTNRSFSQVLGCGTRRSRILVRMPRGSP